jgi:hypothetical protein
MAALTASAATIEIKKGALHGLAGSVGDDVLRDAAQGMTGVLKHQKSVKSCWGFLRTGKCKFGDACKFSHTTKSTGGCAECGGPHDVSKCDKRRAKMAEHRFEARIAHLESAQAVEAAPFDGAVVDLELASVGGSVPATH